MIIAYAGLGFLFYKIFPALAGYPDNTVLGALLMGICTAIILQGFEILSIRSYLKWQAGALSSDRPAEFPLGAALLMLVATAAAAGSCFLVATGFAERLARWGMRHEVEFAVMAAIPPAAYFCLKLWELWKGWRATEAQRQLTPEDRNG